MHMHTEYKRIMIIIIVIITAKWCAQDNSTIDLCFFNFLYLSININIIIIIMIFIIILIINAHGHKSFGLHASIYLDRWPFFHQKRPPLFASHCYLYAHTQCDHFEMGTIKITVHQFRTNEMIMLILVTPFFNCSSPNANRIDNLNEFNNIKYIIRSKIL